MDLTREIYSQMLQWKSFSKGRSALLIEGARRVGKSTIAKKFGDENYKSVAFIDFAKATPELKANFENNLNDLDTFYQRISLECNVRLYNRDSLIIFDEIQKFPRAREAVKYLVEDGRFDILETGSLISIKENVSNIVIPSEEEKIKMHPLSFVEFLNACDQTVLIDYIKECWENKKPLDNSMHRKANNLLFEYMLVGGMPQSVVAYLSYNKDFAKADYQKRRILDLYSDDIKKSATRFNSKVSALFEGIPGFLSQHEKRIKLNQIGLNGVYDMYDEPLFWLEDSMICNLCYRCNDPNVGFALHRDASFVKCYMADTGLLFSHAFSENEIANQNLYKHIMDGKLSINKGMLYENLVAQMIVYQNRKLFFYTHYSGEKHRNDIEIDFLLSNESKTNFKVYPLEVKSSKNYTTTSYAKFKSRFAKRIGSNLVVHPKNLAETDEGLQIPAYMLPFALQDKTFFY